MKITVTPNDQMEIERVYCFHESERLVILRIETKAKRPKVDCFSANSIHVGGSIVYIECLPWEPSISLWGTGRGTLDVLVQDATLETDYCNKSQQPLWARE
jgi:hypothetical protein